MAKNRHRGRTAKDNRKAEAAADAKENAVEVRQAQVEMALPPADRLVHYFDALKHENDIIAKANKSKKAIEKAAESEGVNLAGVKEAIAMEKGDAVVWRQRMEQLAVLMKAKGIPFQMVIWDTAFGSATDQAVFEARSHAKQGATANCRWPEGSPEHEAYMAEYAKIQAGMAPGAQTLTQTDIEDAIRDGRAAATNGHAQKEMAPA